MNTKRRIAERRERNRQLAEADARNRCGMCKRELPKTGVYLRWQDPRVYCSRGCLEDAEERETRGMR